MIYRWTFNLIVKRKSIEQRGGGGLTKLLLSGGIELPSFRLETEKKKLKHRQELNQQPLQVQFMMLPTELTHFISSRCNFSIKKTLYLTLLCNFLVLYCM